MALRNGLIVAALLAATALVRAESAPEPVELGFREIFVQPVGPRGLELTPKARSLAGRRVRITGYMVRRETVVRGTFLLAAVPVALHDDELGPCDDLPASTVFVHLGGDNPPAVDFRPGRLSVVGRLELGNKEEADGRLWALRLYLDPSRP